MGLHSVFVEKIEYGQFVCINSHGSVNQFLRIDPRNTNFCQVYKIKIKVTDKNSNHNLVMISS